MAAHLDETLVPTLGALAVAFKLLLESDHPALDDALGSLDATREDLDTLRRRYLGLREVTGDSPASIEALTVISYLLLRWGRASGIHRAGFEIELANELAEMPNAGKGFLVPFWLPAVPGLHQRDLLIPIIAPARTRVLRAYEGLVHHLRRLGDAAPELSTTAILWRVAALSEGLVVGGGGTLARLNLLRSRVAQDSSVSLAEQSLWDPITEHFVFCRDALTHMTCERNGEVKVVFEDAVEFATSPHGDLIPASTAIGFAVLQDIADQVLEMAPPATAWDRVYSEHAWVDDHG